MFLKKSSIDDIADALKQNLETAESAPLVAQQQSFAKAVQNLVLAANIFDEAGCEKEAAIVTSLLEKISWHVPKNDPAMSGLSADKMESNLTDKGWVFNVNDGGKTTSISNPDKSTKPEISNPDAPAMAEDKKISKDKPKTEETDTAEAEDGEILTVIDPEEGVLKTENDDIEVSL